MKSNIIFLILALLLFSLGYIYLKDISPSFTTKPQLEKPNEVYLTENHIIYMLNELDAYKLHNDPISSEPAVIEVNVDGTPEKFKVEDSKFVRTEELPDIVIYTSEDELIRIFEGDIKEGTVNSIKEGKISIDVISDEKSLILKGYKVIYDKFSSDNITGNVVIPIVNGINVLFLILAAMLMNIVADKI